MKKLLLVGGALVVLLAGVVAVLAWLAVREITPERLVREIEASRNCRAVVDGCRFSLFPGPARLEVTGVTLVPRDSEADRATPVTGRPPIELHATYFRFGSGTLEAGLGDLIFRRRLSIRQCVLRNVDVKCDLLPGGENTLKTLFDSPRTVTDAPGPPLATLPAAAAVAAARALEEAAQGAATTPAEPTTGKPPGPGVAATPPPEPAENDVPAARTFNVRDWGLPANIERVALENARLRFRNRKTRSVIELNGCHASLTDIAVDPADLAAHNRATLDIKTNLLVDSRNKKTKEPIRFASLMVGMHGRITPFELTGALNPAVALEATLHRGSMVDRLPILEKLQKKIERAQQAGLKLGDLSARAELQEDASFNLQVHNNRLRLLDDTRLVFADYTMALDRGAFIDAGDETHDLHASWVASQPVSDKALGRTEEFLGSVGGDTAKSLRALFITPLVKDGRIALAFTSTGELDDPKVAIANPLGEWKDQLKEAGKGLLDRVQGAFNRREDERPETTDAPGR